MSENSVAMNDIRRAPLSAATHLGKGVTSLAA
jgi:hypothetical protein